MASIDAAFQISPARKCRGAFLRSTQTAVVLFTGVVALRAFALEAPPYSSLLQDSAVRAPALVAEAANVRAVEADAQQAHAWLNPRVDALAENLGAPLSDGTSQRQTTYTITQPFEIGGKRGARIEAGRLNVQAAEMRARQTRVEYAAQLAVAYATAEAMQARRAVASENLARAQDELRATQALVAAGREAQLRSAQVQASVAAARADKAGSDAEAAEAFGRLSVLAGSRDLYDAIGRSLLMATSGRHAPSAVVDTMPAVAVARAERMALDAQVDVERKRWIPDLGVSAAARRYGFTNTTGYVVGIGLSVPLFDRNRYGITAATERAEAASARLEAARLEAFASQAAARTQTIASDERLAAATEAEQAASEAYRLGRIGYDAGRTTLVEVLAVRRAYAEAQQVVISARLARIRATAALAQLEGRLAFEELP